MNDRAVGHALSNALQAFRITGDMDIIKQFPWYIKLLRDHRSRLYGTEGGFAKSGQLGFLARAIISYMTEVRGYNRQGWAEAFQLLSGYIEWNRNWGNFGYSVDASNNETGQSAITGQNMADPQAWYYLHTGREKYRQQLLAYIETGINGGCPATGCAPAVRNWKRDGKGGFVGRTSTYVYRHAKTDGTPAARITDLTARHTGDGDIKVTFTAPTGNPRRYHFVYGKRPISAVTTENASKLNWWAAHVYAPRITADPGQTASFVFHTNIADPVYMAIFSFDAHDNLSEMSNVSQVTGVRNADGLLPPWRFDNVGSPEPAGSASYTVASGARDVGIYTMRSEGSFRGRFGEFAYVHRTVSGNHAIVVRVRRGANYFSRVGPMFRETLTSGSAYVALYYSGSQDLRLVYRSHADGNKTTVYLGQAFEPVYLKLVREGDTFTAYASPNGVDWGSPLTSVSIPSMDSAPEAGVALGSSSVDGANFPASASVDHLKVTRNQ